MCVAPLLYCVRVAAGAATHIIFMRVLNIIVLMLEAVAAMAAPAVGLMLMQSTKRLIKTTRATLRLRLHEYAFVHNVVLSIPDAFMHNVVLSIPGVRVIEVGVI